MTPALNATEARTIVVADDEEAIRTLVCEVLLDHGYNVFEVSNGAELLNVLESVPCDLVITDLIMPVMEGMETIRAIRRAHPDVKIIAISGTMHRSYLKAAGFLGANVAVSKPFDCSYLVSVVEQLLAAA